jgi:3-deoxy-D-manno-octulosonic-acid transferase
MLNSVFHILIIISFVIRVPLAFVFIILRPLFKNLKLRIDFERLNLIEESSKSFAAINLSANYLFHVSSEGELEQALTLIEDYLSKGKKIEIVYTSPSVENKCRNLYLKNPHQVRIFRLPVISFFPINFLYFQSIFQFVTAPTIVMCRYDFFPEILYLKYWGKRMILLSATTKKWNLYKEFAFQFFDLIVAATPKEVMLIKSKVKCPVHFMEFRFLRIFKRLNETDKLLKGRPEVLNFCQNLINYTDDKIILGSLWPSDLEIFNNEELINLIKARKCLLVIAPHKLSRDYIDHLIKELSVYFPRELISEIDQDHSAITSPILINTLPGMLCELYQYFDCAYIGGGYEKSIHSVLEPFLMGAKVLCGPKIHRSTEYDYIHEVAPDEIVVLNNPNLFYTKWEELKNNKQGFDRLSLQISNQERMAKIIDLIG